MNVASTQPSPLTSIPSRRISAGTINRNTQSTETSQQDQQLIQKLKARDRVVRAHEAAHVAAGAGLVQGGASFSYQRGPDGVQYAIGGEVSIDTSKVAGDPQASLQKAQQIQAAALAPAQPSDQDRAVAARAAQMAIEARAEIIKQKSDANQSSPLASSSAENAGSVGNLIDFTA